MLKRKKLHRLLFLLLGLILIVGAVQAQEPTKEEVKELKKLAKTYQKNPLSLKALINEKDQLKTEAEDLRAQMGALQSELNQKTSLANTFQEENNLMASEINMLREALREAEFQAKGAEETAKEASKEDEMMKGVVFKVQVGALKGKPMSDDLITTEDIAYELEDGMQKIVVGQFRDYQKAQELRNYFRIMGVKGAWIVSYRDGVRINIEEALKQ